MKTKYVVLSTILAVALTLLAFGQETHGDKTNMKHHDLSKMMGKPVADATVEGLHMKVWLTTQKHHKKIMRKMRHMMMHGEKEGEMEQMETKGMKDTSMAMNENMKGIKRDGKGMNKAMMDSMMTGTHHIMLNVTDAASGKEIADASAKVLIVYPSKKNLSFDLKPMMNHFGGALTLDEKGEYLFIVNVNVGGVSKTTKFQYAVK